MSVRAKFKVTSITDHDGGNMTVAMDPVYSDDSKHENKSFWEATPAGNINLHITNKSAAATFDVGGEYYVDFIPVNPVVKRTLETAELVAE